MSTVDTVFLIITACAISLFFLLGAILTSLAIALVAKAKKLVSKAEGAIDSVEEMTEAFKNLGHNARGPWAAFKVIRSIINLVNKHK